MPEQRWVHSSVLFCCLIQYSLLLSLPDLVGILFVGEIIAMQGLMNMIFEVQDLAVASPATVSRCGMVYVQPSLLGWRPVLVSWMSTLPEGVTEVHRSMIVDLFDWLIPPTLRIALKQVSYFILSTKSFGTRFFLNPLAIHEPFVRPLDPSELLK